MKRWSHKSLEWIHRVREENYNETKDKPPEEVLKNIKGNTDELVKGLGLKIIHPYELTSGRKVGFRG